MSKEPEYSPLLLVILAVLLFTSLSGCTTTRTITVSCITPEQLAELRAAAPPHVRAKLTGRADEDARILAGSALRLREYSDGLIGVLEVCAR